MNTDASLWVRPYQLSDFVIEALRQGLARTDLNPQLRAEGAGVLAAMAPSRKKPESPLDLFAPDSWNPSADEAQKLGHLISRLRRDTDALEPAAGQSAGFSLLREIWRTPGSSFALADDLTLYQEGTASHGTTLPFEGLREAARIKAGDSEPARAWAERIFESSFGIYFLLNQGLNWQFTDLLYDERYKGLLDAAPSLSEADRFFFFQNQTCLATQRRYAIFQRETQKILESLDDGAVLASLPCGRGRALAELDYSRAKKVSLVEMDLDPEALAGASLFTRALPADSAIDSVAFLRRNALDLGICELLNLISSNGLTMYLNDEQRLAFFRGAFAALKGGGVFITSHLTPSGEWDRRNVDQKHLMRAVHLGKLITARWVENARTVAFTVEQLREAGFARVEVHSDPANMFPTFVAHKKLG